TDQPCPNGRFTEALELMMDRDGRGVSSSLTPHTRQARTVAYTDGSCRKHTTGRGGWAVHVVDGDEYVGAVENTTNQRMELFAACVALERIDGDVEVRSDSKFLVSCFVDRRW